MKEYKLVYLNEKIQWSVQKDLQQAQDVINQYAAEGWELQQVTQLNNVMLVGIFFREK